MQLKNILVTGGLGYIGSHTVVALQNAGMNVLIIDDLSNARIDVLNKIVSVTGKKPKCYTTDLKDYEALNLIFESNTIDGVIHFAAYKAVGESVQQPLMYYRNNLLGLINVLEVMDLHNVDHFIFSSSCTVYGQADHLPINENTPIKRPQSPYGNSKKMGEEIIEDFVNATDKNSIILRYFNPIGADAEGILGDEQQVPNNLMPHIVQTALGVQETLHVYGYDYNTRDGTAVRDYIDVNDLADAHIKAMLRLLENRNYSKYEIFNIGSGHGSTVLEIISAFERANSIRVPYELKPRRAGDIDQSYADFSYAQCELGWQPKISLQESMKTAWKFQQNLCKAVDEQ